LSVNNALSFAEDGNFLHWWILRFSKKKDLLGRKYIAGFFSKQDMK
jgi:hypothetical protein